MIIAAYLFCVASSYVGIRLLEGFVTGLNKEIRDGSLEPRDFWVVTAVYVLVVSTLFFVSALCFFGSR